MKRALAMVLIYISIALCCTTARGGNGGVLVAANGIGGERERSNNLLDPAPRMEFMPTEHDFKQVSESGGRVSYDYVVTNTGECPLVITRTIVSCRCVNVNFSKRPIPPSGQAVIRVTYNPRKQQGLFYKAIQIFSNTTEKKHVITLRGEVVP